MLDGAVLQERRARAGARSSSSVGIVVIAGAGNAVNLTDGLDGLAIVPVMIAAATFGLIAYLIGNAKFAQLPADPLRAPAPASWPSSAAR